MPSKHSAVAAMSTEECRHERGQLDIAWVVVIAAGRRAEREMKPCPLDKWYDVVIY